MPQPFWNPGRPRPDETCSARSTAGLALWLAIRLATGLLLAGGLSGCTASSHATRDASLGRPGDLERLEASLARPGPIRFERVLAADWTVALGGLVNLDHPRAEQAGLVDGPEPIEIFFYVLEHPEYGDYLVDSGVGDDFRREGGHPDVSPLVESVMKTEALAIHVTTKEWLAGRRRPLSGVFLTHIHLDHVMGLPDVPEETPIYVGPGETEARAFLNLFTRGTLDRMLERESPLEEWVLDDARPLQAGQQPLAVLDVFGDASLWALHVPGHTPGSMAFLVRTPDGAELLVGDTSHTRWGWENGVEPGTFTADHERNAASLQALRDFAARHPSVRVHLGHQRLGEGTADRAGAAN